MCFSCSYCYVDDQRLVIGRKRACSISYTLSNPMMTAILSQTFMLSIH
jgi:hypothetical protein